VRSYTLLIAACSYLIPQGINAAKPFQHPVIINTLREAFFKHKRGSSFAQKNRLYFPSIESGPKEGELLLPAAVTDLQGPPSERTQSDKIRDLKSLAKQYARDQGSCDDTRISYLEYVESEAEADWTLARMIAG
jgi:hypothetical protein